MKAERDRSQKRRGARGGHRALRAAALAAAVLCAGAAGCAGARGRAETRVARIELVRTGDARQDAFFAVVYSMQVALNEAPRVQDDTMARLAGRLGVAQGDSVLALSSAVRGRAQTLAVAGTRVVILYDERASIDAMLAARTGGGVFPPSQADAERALPLEVHTEGAPLDDAGRALLDEVTRALRTAMALRARMVAESRYARELPAVGDELARENARRTGPAATEVGDELRAARDFVDGVPPRATAAAQQADLLASRLRAALTVSAAP